MRPNSKRTTLAIALVSQAYVLDRMGSAGLDSKKLAALLRDAAHTLDSMVKGPTDK
ncbi:MAG: hypothetical protein ABI665_09315 [Vicinamibacterales bacterium]